MSISSNGVTNEGGKRGEAKMRAVVHGHSHLWGCKCLKHNNPALDQIVTLRNSVYLHF